MWMNYKVDKNIKPDLDKTNYESLNDLFGIKLPKQIDINAFMPRTSVMIVPPDSKSSVPEKVEKVMVELEELPENLHMVKHEHIGITFWNLVRLIFGGHIKFDLDTTERLIGNSKRVRVDTFITLRKGNYSHRS